jgi:multiple antibiotic resistance protein
MEFSQVVNYLVSLMVITSPLSALPALLELSRGKSVKQKRQIAVTTSTAVAIILIVMTWIGTPLLNFFGIKVPAFQIAGGLVLLIVALSMLNAQPSRIQQAKEDKQEAEHKPSIAIVPLAMPMIAGPGAITTVIVGVSTYPGVINHFYLSFCAIIAAFATGSILYFASDIERMLHHTGINIITRIGGLLLASIAIQSIANGVHGLFLIGKL